jgi:hypothetical protein
MDDKDKNFRRQSDHDLLITLNVEVRQLSNDIKLMSDGVSARLLSLEARTKVVEDWISSFKITWKLVLGTATAVGSIMGFSASLLVEWLSK